MTFFSLSLSRTQVDNQYPLCTTKQLSKNTTTDIQQLTILTCKNRTKNGGKK